MLSNILSEWEKKMLYVKFSSYRSQNNCMRPIIK